MVDIYHNISPVDKKFTIHTQVWSFIENKALNNSANKASKYTSVQFNIEFYMPNIKKTLYSLNSNESWKFQL